jgi:hypothetical protein
MIRRLVATIVAATIVASFGGIARAEPSRVVVASRFRVGYGNTIGHTTNECKVKVPRGANGIAVLKAAKRAGCIDSSVLSASDNEGTRVQCINGVCQMFWLAVWQLFYYPGGDHYRLEGFRAGSATTLEFRYTPTA